MVLIKGKMGEERGKEGNVSPTGTSFDRSATYSVQGRGLFESSNKLHELGGRESVLIRLYLTLEQEGALGTLACLWLNFPTSSEEVSEDERVEMDRKQDGVVEVLVGEGSMRWNGER